MDLCREMLHAETGASQEINESEIDGENTYLIIFPNSHQNTVPVARDKTGRRFARNDAGSTASGLRDPAGQGLPVGFVHGGAGEGGPVEGERMVRLISLGVAVEDERYDGGTRWRSLSPVTRRSD